jgi:preprotein translocase subunit YajC
MSSPDGSTPATPSGAGPVGEELIVGSPKARRGTTMAIALITGGAVAGGILASTLGASAASTNTASTSGAAAAAPAASSSDPSAGPNVAPGKRGNRPAPLTGTVTAVGSGTITIKTSTATTTYTVTSDTKIFKTGEKPDAAKLTDVVVGDTVFFDTTASGGDVIGFLFDGKLPAAAAFGGPGHGGLGGQFGARGMVGTVTAVDADTITIKTGTTTTTYSVTSASVLDKPGTPPTTAPSAGTDPTPVKPTTITLADVKVGDTVFFGTTTSGGTIINHLLDGKLPIGRGFRGGGPGRGGFGGQLGRELTGTVTAVGSGTVTIKTGTTATAYSVTSTSVLDKAPTAPTTPPTTPPSTTTKPTPVKPTTITLGDIKVGDTVFFGTTTSGGTIISHLTDGKLPAFGGRGGGGFGGGPGGGLPGGPGGGMRGGPFGGGGPGQNQVQPNATTAPATGTSTGLTT